MAMVCALLMAFSSPVLEPIKVSSNDEEITPPQVEEIYFGEDCTNCRYITVYNEKDQLVFDKLIRDADNIDDPRLKKILNDSYYLMSNSITDYYILSE